MLVARVYTCPRDIIVNSMGKDVKNNCDNSDNNYFFFFFFFLICRLGEISEFLQHRCYDTIIIVIYIYIYIYIYYIYMARSLVNKYFT